MNKGVRIFGGETKSEEIMMRGISLLLLGAFLVSCTTAPPPPSGTAERENRLQQLVAGKLAGTPQSCIPTITSHTNDMVVVDDQTLVFKAGGGRVYVNHLSPGCDHIGLGNSLITKQSSASSLCRGDIAQLQNLTAGTAVGSCVLGDFVPYAPAGG